MLPALALHSLRGSGRASAGAPSRGSGSPRGAAAPAAPAADVVAANVVTLTKKGGLGLKIIEENGAEYNRVVECIAGGVCERSEEHTSELQTLTSSRMPSSA